MKRLLSLISAVLITLVSFTTVQAADSKKTHQNSNTQLVKSSCNGLRDRWNF